MPSAVGNEMVVEIVFLISLVDVQLVSTYLIDMKLILNLPSSLRTNNALNFIANNKK